jgi:DNA-binding NtrC family response regulator
MNRILVADDQSSVLYSFQKAFGKDYHILTADTGEETLHRIQKSPPELLFLDVHMPRLSGLDVLKMVKEQYPRLPVIIMTAYSDADTAVQAMKLGAFDCITKPFENADIRQLIQKAFHSTGLSGK